MTNDSVTAATVNERINKMGTVFKDLQGRVDAMNGLITGLLVPDDDELAGLLEQIVQLDRRVGTSPALRREAATELAETREKIALVEGRMEDIEAEMVLNISAEIDPETGKSPYSNEKTRQAALRMGLRHSDEYAEVAAELRPLNAQRAQLEAQIKEIEDKDRADRLTYSGVVARLDNINARITGGTR